MEFSFSWAPSVEIISEIVRDKALGAINSQEKNSKLDEKAQWAEPVSHTFHCLLRKLYTEPSIGVSYQISVHLANSVSDEKIF